MPVGLEALLAEMSGHGARSSDALAARIAQERFALDGTVERLTGERDENFRLTDGSGDRWVVKLSHPDEDPNVTEFLTAALLHIAEADPSLPVPRIRRDRDGALQARIVDEYGRTRTARVLSFLPGRSMRQATRSAAQRAASGRIAARMGLALRSFTHPAARRTLLWDFRMLPQLGVLLDDLPAFAPAPFIAAFIRDFAPVVAALDRLPQQVVHHDLHALNLLTDEADADRIVGIIDFGDMLQAPLVCDVAITAMSQVVPEFPAADAIGDMLAAYEELRPLDPIERALLPRLVAARAVMDVLIPSWHRARNPGDVHHARVDEDLIRRRLALADELSTSRLA